MNENDWLIVVPTANGFRLGLRDGGVPHDHMEHVEGCFRCDLSREQADDA